MRCVGLPAPVMAVVKNLPATPAAPAGEGMLLRTQAIKGICLLMREDKSVVSAMMMIVELTLIHSLTHSLSYTELLTIDHYITTSLTESLAQSLSH